MERLKVFVSAYACEPGMGSEIGVGWHWVLEMSRRFELWVLTRESNRRTIAPWVAEHPEYAGIHWLYFDWPDWARWWKCGMRGVRIYYNLWQWTADGIVRRTMRREGIEVFHHLTYGNAVWPVSRYGSRQCFVWGPVSAGVMLPADFTRHFRPASRLKEWVQRVVARTLPYNMGFRSRCHKADLILCKTDHTIACVPVRDRHKCVHFTDVAVEMGAETDAAAQTAGATSGPIRFLAAGTLVGWRSFDVLVLAFAEARRVRTDIVLDIVGDGSERGRLEALVRERGIGDCVRFHGQLNMVGYRAAMAAADVVVNPCQREGAVTVSFDSMRYARPLICFDTGGYTHYFHDDYACVISGITTRAEAVRQLADRMLYMADRDRIARMGALAHEAGRQYDWAHKGERIAEAIEQCWAEYAKRA